MDSVNGRNPPDHSVNNRGRFEDDDDIFGTYGAYQAKGTHSDPKPIPSVKKRRPLPEIPTDVQPWTGKIVS